MRSALPVLADALPGFRHRGLSRGLEITFDRRTGAVTYCDLGGYQSRVAALVHLFVEALRVVKDDLHSFRIFVSAGDQPARGNGRQFAFCRRSDQTDVVLVPDYFFWSWPEVGIPDYSDLIRQMQEAGKTRPADDRLFWVGNVASHPNRKALIDLARGRDDMLIESIEWVPEGAPERNARDSAMRTTGGYYSLPDHCAFRYLIDVEGVGYSARLKALLFSRRPVFIQERPWREFFFDDLVAFTHYIPVAPSLEDLDEKLRWARAHESETERIAQAALDFAKQRLTREAAIVYLRDLLLREFGAKRR